MTDYTKNFSFELIDFNLKPWQDKEYANWRALDAILGTFSVFPNNKGLWQNKSTYPAGSFVLDPITLTYFNVVVSHTTPDTGSFSDYRVANPGYYNQVYQNAGTIRYDGVQALSPAQQLQGRQNLGLVDESHQFTQPGYQKFPSGLIAQWGIAPASNSTADLQIQYPVVFPNAVRFITAQPSASVATNGMYACTVSNANLTQFVLSRRFTQNGSTVFTPHDAYWSAWGY